MPPYTNYKEEFEKYLGNSQDCETLYLALGDKYEFEQCYETMHDMDLQDADVLVKHGTLSYPFTVETSRQMLFDFIREVWDAAYNHGYHDGAAESGVTLAEMEDE